jgi:hypothetical protein
MHTHIFVLAIFVNVGFGSPLDSPKGSAMTAMMDLGTFGDDRLKKRGPIFWRRYWPSKRLACVGSAATARRR